jgi:hypothetical protein
VPFSGTHDYGVADLNIGANDSLSDHLILTWSRALALPPGYKRPGWEGRPSPLGSPLNRLGFDAASFLEEDADHVQALPVKALTHCYFFRSK